MNKFLLIVLIASLVLIAAAKPEEHRPAPTDAAGNPLTKPTHGPRPTDAAGNPITRPRPTDAAGNPITRPRPTLIDQDQLKYNRG